MRVAIYARVSTKDKGQDPENQLRQLREFATRIKCDSSTEYVDYISAGGSKYREQFDLMFTHAYQKKIDIVLFWSLDRFSREGPTKTLNLLTQLNDWGVGWRSYTEQYLDSTGLFKEAIIGILAAIAHQERVRISERVKAGLEKTVAAGQKLGRKLVTDVSRKSKSDRSGTREIGKTANINEIRKLRSEGKSIRQIEELTGVKRSSVARLLERGYVHNSLP